MTVAFNKFVLTFDKFSCDILWDNLLYLALSERICVQWTGFKSIFSVTIPNL